MPSILAILSLVAFVAVLANANLVDFEQLGYGGSGFNPKFDVVPMQSSRTGVNFETYRNMQKDYVSSPMFQHQAHRQQLLEKRPQSPWPLRNCYLSPVQCLLPVQQHQFNKFHKRFML